jgi:PAS domain S-box-containing protein
MIFSSYSLILFLLWIVTLIILIFYIRKKKMDMLHSDEKQKSRQEEVFDAYRKSDERYQKLITQMNEGLIFTDDRDKVRFINQCACAILKLDPEKVLNRSVLDFVFSCREARKLKLPSELKRLGKSHREEIQMVKGNGELFWASLGISYLDELHDHMPGAIITMTDITEQKQTEEKLHKLTANLNQKVKQLDCLFDISDVTYSRGINYEDVFRRALDIIPQGLKYSHDAWVEIVCEGKRYASDNFKETRWSYLAPIRVNNKKIGYIRSGYLESKPLVNNELFHINEKILLKNIAEKLGRIMEINNLEGTLREGLGRLKQLQSISRIGDWEWDLVSGKKTFSPGFFEIMGVMPERQQTYNETEFYKQVVSNDLATVEKFVEQVKSGNVVDLAHAYRIHTDQKQLRYIYSNGKLVYDCNRKPVRIIGTVQDFTGQIAKLEALQ